MTDRDIAYRRIAWRILPILMLGYLMASLDRSNVAFAKLQFSEALGFDDAVFGLGAGIFALGYLAFEVPSNMLLGRIGVRATLLRIMLAWGLCCALMAAMTASWHFYLLRLLLGIAEAGFFPGVIFYLTRWAPMARRARLTALFMAAIPMSGMLGGPISVSIMQGMAGVHGLAGWQWLFIIEGVFTCVVGVATVLVLRESPAAAPWLTEEQKALVQADLAADAPRAGEPGGLGGVWQVLRTPAFLGLGLTAFALLTSTSGAFLWLPTILKKAGVQSVMEIGLYSSIPFAVGALAQYLVARSSDRTGERRLHVALSLLVGAAGWVLAAIFNASTVLSLCAMSIAIAGTFGVMGPFWTLPPKVFAGRSAAVGIAIVTTIGGVGNFISPPIVGFISANTGSLAAGQIYFAALMLLSAAGVLVLIRPHGAERPGLGASPQPTPRARG